MLAITVHRKRFAVVFRVPLAARFHTLRPGATWCEAMSSLLASTGVSVSQLAKTFVANSFQKYPKSSCRP